MIRYLIVVLFALNSAAQTQCEGLKALALPDTTITAAELVPAAPYKPASKAHQSGLQQSATSWNFHLGADYAE